MAGNLTNGTPGTPAPFQLSFPLPNAPQTKIHLHLTNQKHALLIFLTTTGDAGAGPSTLGSFVYSIPNRADPSAISLSTPLYVQTQTLDFATRLAKAVAKRSRKPTYVGSSMSFSSAGRGGDVEEEMEGFKKVVEVVMRAVDISSTRR